MAITFQQFANKYLGKQVEYHSFDPKAKYQCVDLVNQYIVEVLGLTPVIGTHAKDFPSKIKTTEFEVLKNTPDFIPVIGDIAIWNGKSGGGYGHIAVVSDNKATTKKFNSLDQNWSKPLFVTFESHSYTNVSHFLRSKKKAPKPVEKTYSQKEWDDLRHENQDNWDKWQAAEKRIIEYEQATKTNTQRREVLAQNLGVIDDWDEIINASARFRSLDEKNLELQDTLEREMQDSKKRVLEYEQKLEDLKKEMTLMREDYEQKLANVEAKVDKEIAALQKQKEQYETVSRFMNWVRKLFKKDI
jgi:hypothetical protein